MHLCSVRSRPDRREDTADHRWRTHRPQRADDHRGPVGTGRKLADSARRGDSHARHRAGATGAMIVPKSNLRGVRRVPGPAKGASGRAILLIVGVVVAGAVGWVLWVNGQIRYYARRDEARPADAIAVFGAAEYDGRPSPVLRARLDHALELYQRGLAPLMITLGGGDPSDLHSEGGVGHDYLLAHGVPEKAII